jgi:hypothetical protein
LFESASCSRNGVVIEQSAGKGVVSQTDRGTLVVQYLDMLRRSGTGNDEPNGIGARIDRG